MSALFSALTPAAIMGPIHVSLAPLRDMFNVSALVFLNPSIQKEALKLQRSHVSQKSSHSVFQSDRSFFAFSILGKFPLSANFAIRVSAYLLPAVWRARRVSTIFLTHSSCFGVQLIFIFFFLLSEIPRAARSVSFS